MAWQVHEVRGRKGEMSLTELLIAISKQHQYAMHVHMHKGYTADSHYTRELNGLKIIYITLILSKLKL